LIWWGGGSVNAGYLPGFLMYIQFSRSKGRQGKGLNVKNTCKNAKQGPQHLLIKSCLDSCSVQHRGHSNLTCTPTTLSTSSFLVHSGGLNALVSPMLGKKDLLNLQSLGCASRLGLHTNLVEALHALRTDARKLCLTGLSTGPFALMLGPVEDNFFLILITIGLNGNEKGQIAPKKVNLWSSLSWSLPPHHHSWPSG